MSVGPVSNERRTRPVEKREEPRQSREPERKEKPAVEEKPKGHSDKSTFQGSPTATDRNNQARNDPKQTSREQADRDFEKDVKNVNGDTPTSKWDAAQAARYTDAVAKQVEKHKGDDAYQTQLLQRSAPGLQRSAQILGQATDEDMDEGAVEDLSANYSRIGNAVNDQNAARMAVGLANEINEDSELHHVDDGFNRDEAGGTRFRDFVAAALQDQDKNEAADELVNTSAGGGGFNPIGAVTDAIGSIKDLAGDAAGALGDVASGGASAAWNFAGDAAETAVDVHNEVGNFALEQANNAWQRAGDVARAPLDAGLDVAEFGLNQADRINPGFTDGVLDVAQDGVDAGQKGLEITNQVQETVGAGAVLTGQGLNDAAHAAIKDPVGTAKAAYETGRKMLELADVEQQIDNLGEGDTFKMEGQIEGSLAGVNGQLKGTMEVAHNDDGSYTLSVDGEMGAGVAARLGTQGAGAGGEASLNATAGAKVEFKFDSAEEAARASRTFMGPVAGGVSSLLGGDGLSGAIPDPMALKDNLSAVELHGGVAAELAGSVGFGKSFGAGLEGRLEGQGEMAARIEFQDGKPPEIVFRQSLEASASGSAGVGGGFGAPGDANDPQVRGKTKAGLPNASANANASGSIELEERFRLPEGLDIGDVVSDPVGTVKDVAREAYNTGEMSVTFKGTAGASAGTSVGGSAGGQIQAEVTASGKLREMVESGAIGEALDGNFGRAMDLLAPHVQVSGSVNRVTTRSLGIEAGAGDGVDSLSVGLSGTTTDVGAPIASFDNLTLDQARDQMADLLRQQQVRLPVFG